MRSKKACILDIEGARSQLEDWRKSRSRGQRIPAALWTLAAALAKQHGVSRVAQRLGLDYNGLKRRTQAKVAPPPTRLNLPPGFVELPLIGAPVPGPTCIVELARGEAARMTIRWAGKEGLDLVGLVEAFWRSGP
jgi:hypothetical protein